MNDTFEDTGAVELTVLDDDALDNVTGGLLNRSFVRSRTAVYRWHTNFSVIYSGSTFFFRLFLSRHRLGERPSRRELGDQRRRRGAVAGASRARGKEALLSHTSAAGLTKSPGHLS